MVHIGCECRRSSDAMDVASALGGISCRAYVEDFKATLEARTYLEHSPRVKSVWSGMPELTYRIFQQVSSKVDDQIDKAESRRRDAHIDGLHAARSTTTTLAFERVLHKHGLTGVTVHVDTKQRDTLDKSHVGLISLIPVYPYRNLELRTQHVYAVACYRGRGVWAVDPRADVRHHVRAFATDIDRREKTDESRWRCPCCDVVVKDGHRHCKTKRHETRFWDLIDDVLEELNDRLLRGRRTNDDENRQETTR